MRPLQFMVLIMLLAGSALAGVPREEATTYTVLKGFTPSCMSGETGEGCFALNGDEHTVHLVVHDVTGLDVGMDYTFWSANSMLDVGQFCGASMLEVPRGAIMIELMPDYLGSAGCVAPAVAGTVTAQFA